MSTYIIWGIIAAYVVLAIYKTAVIITGHRIVTVLYMQHIEGKTHDEAVCSMRKHKHMHSIIVFIVTFIKLPYLFLFSDGPKKFFAKHTDKEVVEIARKLGIGGAE